MSTYKREEIAYERRKGALVAACCQLHSILERCLDHPDAAIKRAPRGTDALNPVLLNRQSGPGGSLGVGPINYGIAVAGDQLKGKALSFGLKCRDPGEKLRGAFAHGLGCSQKSDPAVVFWRLPGRVPLKAVKFAKSGEAPWL